MNINNYVKEKIDYLLKVISGKERAVCKDDYVCMEHSDDCSFCKIAYLAAELEELLKENN